MEIEGHVTTMHNGDTVVSFTSNHHLAIYQCIFMPDRIETPLINTCELIKELVNELLANNSHYCL